MSKRVFPNSEPAARCDGDGGLTKRELFAAMALQGLLMGDGPESSRAELSWQQVGARQAVECADALIAELAKEPKN